MQSEISDLAEQYLRAARGDTAGSPEFLRRMLLSQFSTLTPIEKFELYRRNGGSDNAILNKCAALGKTPEETWTYIEAVETFLARSVRDVLTIDLNKQGRGDDVGDIQKRSQVVLAIKTVLPISVWGDLSYNLT